MLLLLTLLKCLKAAEALLVFGGHLYQALFLRCVGFYDCLDVLPLQSYSYKSQRNVDRGKREKSI